MNFKYSNEKNNILRTTRNIDFEDIIDAITGGNLILIEKHPNSIKYPNQELMYVMMEEEVYIVPFIEESEGIFFLKTAYPSRKAREKILKLKGKNDKNNNT